MAKIAVDIDSTLYDFDTLAREASLALWQERGDEDFRRGIYYSSEDWRAPAELLGIDKWLQVIARCHDDEMILKQAPFTGAVETCQALMDAGHELIYISNRATETVFATQQWLLNNEFFPRDYFAEDGRNRFECGANPTTGLVVTTGDKTPFIKDCQYIIDDRLKTVVEFVYDYAWKQKSLENWVRQTRLMTDEDDTASYTAYLREDKEAYLKANERKAFVLKYPYNQNATDIPGLYLAPTWAGLNVYMAKKGLLPEVAYKAMELV